MARRTRVVVVTTRFGHPEFHGAAHQKPQEFQVMTSKNRKRITCGRVTIRFVAKKWRDNIPTDLLKSLRGFFQVSTPEVTAFDLLLYPEYAGGLNNIATVLSELSEQLDVKKLVTCLEKIVKKKGKAIIPLVASGSRMGVKIDRKWNLFVNEKIEPDV